MKKLSTFWNDLSIFWKTFILSMCLACSVVFIGEGSDDLVDSLFKHLGLPSNDDFFESLLWLIAIIISSLGGSFILSRLTTGALTQLHAMALKLAGGDMSCRLKGPDLKRGDEIGDLARSFNHMADSISSHFDSERRLIRDISHELRSPLGRMKMSLALLERKVEMLPKETADEYLGQLSKDVERMENMVTQMLDQARMERQSRSGLEKNNLDLRRLLSGSIEELAFKAGEENKRILLKAPMEVPFPGNEGILKQAVDNLLKNALTYTGPGGTVTVTISAGVKRLLIEVCDQGPGVSENLLNDIFTPFFRGDPARSPDGGGFGLGLAIAWQAVQMHSGWLEAANIIDEAGLTRGLKMTMFLPLTAESGKK